ncbi:hypothetical protein CesoFtcFv8_020849 [Champsocephalus esox]|uniref:Uncharacterized protein n=1 Tax=Champsocephalus esox TaxID=159716 RepID=A0AAN8GKG9_9TELE|nr:hypothetical protein CesoFtcFv8_020849 [Champsocephalus esox]
MRISGLDYRRPNATHLARDNGTLTAALRLPDPRTLHRTALRRHARRWRADLSQPQQNEPPTAHRHAARYNGPPTRK